jgi:hypothetical protein
MSYDLAVFDPEVTPRTRVDFRAWFDRQTEWTESHGYNDPDVRVPALRNWFRDMITSFPPMNGPLRSANVDDPSVTDYSVGRHLIYGAFASSVGAAAYQAAWALAQTHRVGIYNLSDDPNDIWIPGPTGNFTQIL